MEKQIVIIEQPIDIVIKTKRGQKPTQKEPPIDDVIVKTNPGKPPTPNGSIFQKILLR